jgi:hypothetical protein
MSNTIDLETLRKTDYHSYLRKLDHVLRLDDSGNVDVFGLCYETHNGPVCINCGDSWCQHCADVADKCEY